MKFSSFSKFIGASAIATSLAILPLTLPAPAQDNAPGTTTEATPAPPNPLPDHTERDDSNDFGWLGLIGLAGLAGLAAKKRAETVHHVNREPDAGTRSGSNYR